MNLSHRTRRMLLIFALIAVVGAGAIGLGPARPTIAAPDAPNAPDLDLPLPNIIVNTTDLTADLDGKCDLWEALQAVFQANYGMSPTYHECTAKANGMNIIAFSVVGGTITVPTSGSTSDLPFVHGETVILGPITIAGSGSSADTHLLRTAPGAKLTVIAVVLKNGHTSGAGPAIYSDNGASVNVIGSFLVNNVADADGGAIYSNGDLNLIGTSFINNKALGLAGTAIGVGGAIRVTGVGSFKSEASTYTNNQAVAGGAIQLEKSGGESSISESVFTANGVSADANGFGGGAVYNANTGGTLEINRTAFNANYSTQGTGGAIVNKVSAITYISNTLFDANVAGDAGTARIGGAIYNQGALSIVKSTLIANVATGGNGGGLAAESNGAVTIANSTFFGNLADSQGGALYGTANAGFTIRNSTFSANIADTTGDILYLGGSAHASIGNTIFDGSTTPHPNCAGVPVNSLGHNIDTGGSCNLMGSGDMPNTNPVLGALGFHGGGLPVLTTQVPDYTSLAVDHGDAAICGHASVDNEDETGTQRPKDANNVGSVACDIGAVEVSARKPAFDATPMPPGPINFGSVEVGKTLTTSFTVHNAGNYVLTVSGPVMGDPAHFGIVTPTFPIDLSPNGVKTIVLSCTPTVADVPLVSTFSFNTTDADKSNVSYSLMCVGKAQAVPAFASSPVAPGPIEFGEVTIGQLATQTITIKNNGSAQLTLNQPGFTSDGNSFTHDLASTTNLAPGATSQITVQCQPQPNRVGPLVGQLHFSTNDASQALVSYNLNCNAVSPQSAYLVNTWNLRYPLLPTDFTSPFGVATSPDGVSVYINGMVTGGGQVAVVSKVSAGIYLSTSQVTSSLLGNPHEMKVSPDGQFLIAVGANNALVEYLRDSSGALTHRYSFSDSSPIQANLGDPFGVAFSPDSQFVYVTNYLGNSISIFKYYNNPFTQNIFLPTSVVTQTTMTTHTLQNPTGIVVSPDGKNVYVAVHTANPGQGTLAVYQRNSITGALTPIQTRYEGDTQDSLFCFPFCISVQGLASAYQLAISPDGGNVYVTSGPDHAIANFRRDLVTGKLHYNGRLLNGSSGITGLTAPYGIAVSPDSKHVYVTGQSDNTLVMFNRENVNGALTFYQMYQRNASGSPALGSAYQTAVSSDGQSVFTVGQSDKALAILQMANPIPTLFNLQPASVSVGSADFTLVVKGSGFVDGAYVAWNGFHPTTTYFNSSELHVTIPAAWLAAAGTPTIMVHNPTPGGGDSFNTLTFQIISPVNGPSGPDNPTVAGGPVPTIDHLVPASVKAGASGNQVDVYGSNFSASGLTITANGGGVAATYIDSTHVKITSFNVNTFAQPGTVNIRANNNGVQSNIVGLKVTAPGKNLVPSIKSMSPDWVWSLGAASPQLTLVITGTNFVDGAVVLWNGDERPTKFISKTKVQATISGSDQLDPAYNSIIVKNPTPGGGESNVTTLVVRPLFQLFVPFVKS